MTSTFQKLPETRRREILDAAASVFARKGYFQAGIVEICQAADMSNGALYKYFKNKEDLYVAVARRAGEVFMEKAAALAEGEMSLWERFRRMLDEVLPFTETYRDYVMVYMELGSPSMDFFASELSDEMEILSVAFFRHLIEEARAQGEIRPGVSAANAAYIMDNHLMLFAFSCVSEHYNRRFRQFFENGTGPLGPGRKVNVIMDSLRQLLAKEDFEPRRSTT